MLGMERQMTFRQLAEWQAYANIEADDRKVEELKTKATAALAARGR